MSRHSSAPYRFAVLGVSLAALTALAAPAFAQTPNASPRPSAQPRPAPTTPTPTPTPHAARNLAQEEANRRLVTAFYDGVFNRHDVARASEVVADSYIQHNPGVPTGKAPFVDYFTGYFRDHPQARSRIVHSATDGDLVFLHVHSTETPADRGRAIVDIFRVTNGKITEHWDVVQPVPEPTANTNTMF